MTIVEAQADARRSYVNGAAGVAVSGLVWVIVGLVALGTDVTAAMIALFIGGMAINPVSELIGRYLFKRGKPDKANQLIWIGLLTVPVILTGMFAGYLLSETNAVWFFALTLMAVGTRYLSFKTLYGLNHYIMLGFALLGLGFAAIALGWVSPGLIALAGGGVELLASVIVYNAKPAPTT